MLPGRRLRGSVLQGASSACIVRRWKRFLEAYMRLASADFTWPGLRPEFVLDLIAELDLQGVSMAFMGGHTARRPEDVAQDPEGWGERVAGELADRGLQPADVFLIPRI